MSKKISFLSRQKILATTKIETVLEILLKNRDIIEHEAFLKPLPPKADPKEFNLDSEVFKQFINHLQQLLRDHKKILIYGDYDVDGLTSTSQLYLALSSISQNIMPYIPHRQKDGYGLKSDAVFGYIKNKSWQPDVVLTIDNGISAKNEVAKLQQAGIEVMIIDHHLSGQAVPDVKYILHSTQTSASGLAWLVAKQFIPDFPLDLAILGIVSDCLSLTGLNRQMLYHGLPLFRQTSNFGLQALIQNSGLSEKDLSVYDLAFKLAPRLNAAGRLDDGMISLRLLCVQNHTLAVTLAKTLDEHNSNRQNLQAENLSQATNSLDLQKKLLFIHNPSFHPGLIGLLAGRLTESYYRPSIVTTQINQEIKGSCRSIPEFNITAALEKLRHLCLDLGGHTQAAGFSLKPENLDIFKEQIEAIASQELSNLDLTPTIFVDAPIDLSAISTNLIFAINKLSPFGQANPEPTFYLENLTITTKYILGSKNEHLKFIFNNSQEGILFSAPKENFDLKVGDTVSLVAKLSLNTYQGYSKPQLMIKYIEIQNGSSNRDKNV